MSNFALDTGSSAGDIISGLNYALANLGNQTGSTSATANVLTANTATGTVTTTYSNVAGYTITNIVGYLYPYVAIKYANSATGGTGFSSNSVNSNYYGVYNSPTGVISSNPVDYSWTQVAGGFGTTKYLYYTNNGGNIINFAVANAAPASYYTNVIDNTPIYLPTVSNTLVSTGAMQSQAATQVVSAQSFASYPLINFTNGNATIGGTGYLWPPFTRGFVGGGGVTLQATTTGSPTGAAVQVSYSTYINSATSPEYNCVELWRSGSNAYYKDTFRNVRSFADYETTFHTDYFTIVGDNGSFFLGNLGNITNQSNNSVTSNFLDGRFQDAYGQNGAFTQYEPDYFSGNVYGYMAGQNTENTNAALPVFNIYGASVTQIPTTPPSYPLIGYAAILVGSAGQTAFWSGQSQYRGSPTVGTQQAYYSPLSTGIFADLLDVATDLPSTELAQGLTYNYVVVGTGGTILYQALSFTGYARIASSTGWAVAASGTISNLNAVASNFQQTSNASYTRGNVWVAVGDSGTIIYSSGTGSGPWLTANSVPVKSRLNGIAYSNGNWVAVGDNGVIITSTDGSTWTGPVVNPADGHISSIGVRNLYGVAGGPSTSQFVAAGEEIILLSNTVPSANSWTSNIYLGGSSLNTSLTRLQYFGSWANVANTSQPPTSQRVTNAQIVSGNYIDTDYVTGEILTYYLVLGNMAGNVAITTNSPNLTVTEIKR